MLKAALEQYQAGQLAQAAQTCQQMLQQQPNHTGALHLIGLIAARQGRFEDAIALYHRVLALQPQHLEAQNNLGIALMQLGRLEAAIAAYRQALKFAPRSPEVLVNLGNALQAQGDLTRSVCCYKQALAQNPNLSAAHKNLAHVLRMQGQTAAAILHHQRAIALAPNDAEAHFGYAFTLLIDGDLQTGFAEYEWRWRLAYNPPRRFTQPRWNGAPLNGKTLLLWAEQGFGDTIQFIRYVSLLAQGRVIVEAQPSLRSLLTSVLGIAQVIPQGEPLPPFDLQAPLLSIPHLLKTSIDTIPANVPYLHPSQSIDLPGKFKIGIAWAGDPKNPINQRRSCPVDQFLKLRSIPDVTLYSLQKDHATELPEDVIDLSDRLQDFADTAAIVAELDLVISIDTALAHLAGALGKPVWVVLPFSPDWRWLLHRSDCPWYPTMRLFRQSQANDWDSVFAQVEAELRRLKGDPTRSIDTLALHCSTWTEAATNLALQLQQHCCLKLLSPPDLNQIANPLDRHLLAQLPVIPTADCPVLDLLDRKLAERYRSGDRSIEAPVKIGWLLSDEPEISRLNGYDWLIVSSAKMAQRLEAQGINCVSTIDPGIDPTIFHPVKRSPHRDRFVIFAAGEPSDLVVAAFDRFAAEHPAQLITSWPLDTLLPDLHLGSLNAAALSQVLHSVNAVLAIDPTTEASAIAALACGLPTVITADFDWANHSIAFVLPTVAVESVVDRLLQIHNDPEAAQAKGSAACEQLQNQTWECQTLKLIEVLKQNLT